MRLRTVAVTGARGRLGRALVERLGSDGVVRWGRPELDLDRPASFLELLERDSPTLVIHAAAMTDVDACAREPHLAVTRNGLAVGALARACRARSAALAVISTNEVFDGERSDGAGYREDDEPRPRNAYGVSKLAGEREAQSAFDGAPGLWVVRTAWVFGPPGNDFPSKIVAAADRLPEDVPLPVVEDEHGSPTYTVDLAHGIVDLVERTTGGLFHLVNAGHVSRLGWAQRVLAARRPGRALRAIRQADYERPSKPPRWGVIDASLAAGVAGVELRSWEDALSDYLSR